MKARISSILIGVIYLITFWCLGNAASRFGEIYDDLFSKEVVLPILTRGVLAFAPFGWIGLGVAAFIFCVGKDKYSFWKKFPNWPFVLVLFAVLLLVVIALFEPMIITIQSIESP